MTSAPEAWEQAGRSEDSLREQARKLVEEADCEPPCDLVTWAQGFCAGWDARDNQLVPPWLWRLSEDLAQLDRTTFVPFGTLSRERRIARDVADDRHATPVKGSDGWPPVTIPGGGS